MKVKCHICRHELEFNELDFAPGDSVSVECPRCGSSEEVVIPAREGEDVEKKSNVKVRRITDEKSIAEEKSDYTENLPAESVVISDYPESLSAEITETNADETQKTDETVKLKIENLKPKRTRKPKTVNQSENNGENTANEINSSNEVSNTSEPKPRKKTVKPKQIPTPPPAPSSKDNEWVGGCGCLIIALSLVGWFVYWIWPSSYDKSTYNEDVIAVEECVETDESDYIPEDVIREEYEYDTLVEADSTVVMDELEVAIDSVCDDNIYNDTSSHVKMGFHSGHNSFIGKMIHTDGRIFPFTLEFDYSPSTDRISNVRYVNTTSGTALKLSVVRFEPSLVRFEGSDGGKLFVIEFSDTTPYTGDAWWGDFHQDIELMYRD